MSDRERLAEVLRGAVTGCDPLAFDNLHSDWAIESVANDLAGALLASDALAGMLAEARAEGAAEVRARVEAVLDDLPSRYTVGPENFMRVMDLQDADVRAALTAEDAP